MVYIVHYTCPHCKNAKCGDNPMKRANELIVADSRTEAKNIFNRYKQCRYMKICEIKETTL